MNEKKDEMLEEFSSKVDDIFATLNGIRIATNTSKFKKWYSETYRKKVEKDIFIGYRFFVETLVRGFMNSIIYDTTLPLDEDFVFARARFVGVELNKIPDTCKKTIVLKNINKHRRSIKKSKNWQKLQNALDKFKEEILDPFDKIFKKNIEVSDKINIEKDKALSFATMFYLFIYLNDTSRFIPHGYYVSVIRDGLRKEIKEKAFSGYKFTLQYFWYHLLGEKKYKKTSLKNLHTVTDWSMEEDFPEFDGEIKDFSEIESEPISDKVEKNEDRNDLDSYFTKVKKEIIKPIEKDLKIDLGFSKFFVIKNEILLDQIQNLLKKQKKVQLNEKDKLNEILLWYQIEFLGTSKSHIFNGVPMFIRLMIGSAEIKRLFGIGEEVHVRRFIHPDKSVNGNDFSYAVLIEAFGSSGLADYSGWGLFYDCCGDYSGFAGGEHLMAEKVVELYEKKGWIEVREMKIDKEKFKEYVAENVVSGRKKEIMEELELFSIERNKRSSISESRGIVLELLSYYTLSKNKMLKNVDWNVKKNGDELDIILEDKDSIKIIECKTDPNTRDMKEEIKKLKEKVKNYVTSKDVIGEFWFWERPSTNHIDLLKKEKINYELFSKLIEEIPLWKDKNKKKIKTIFKKIDTNYLVP